MIYGIKIEYLVVAAVLIVFAAVMYFSRKKVEDVVAAVDKGVKAEVAKVEEKVGVAVGDRRKADVAVADDKRGKGVGKGEEKK